MIKLGLKLIFLTFLVLVLSQVAYQTKSAPDWGNNTLFRKQFFFNKKKNNFNTVILGSSFLFRGLDPNVLDANMDSIYQIRSFNFANNLHLAPQTYFLLEELLETKSPHLKYALIELSDVYSIENKYMHTNRIKQLYDYPYFMFCLGSVLHSDYSLLEKVQRLFNHFITFLERTFCIELFSGMKDARKDMLGLTIYKDVYAQETKEALMFAIGSSYNGFLGDSLTYIPEIFDQQNRSSFLADTLPLYFKRETSLDIYDQMMLHGKSNEYHMDKIKELIARAEQAGVYVIFLLTPRHSDESYRAAVPIYRDLPAKNRIELSDSYHYPEFYMAKYSFDYVHLNEAGAEIFSKELAIKFNKLLRQREEIP